MERLSRRQFLRRVSALGAGLALAGPILAACGPTPQPTATPTPAPKPVAKEPTATPKAPVTVEKKEAVKEVTPAAKEVVKIRCNSWFNKWFKTYPVWTKRFEGKYPHIKVEIEEMPSGKLEYQAKLESQMVAGTIADCMVPSRSHTQNKFYDTGYTLDLTDRVKADGINLVKDYCLCGAEIWCGRIFALPGEWEMGAIFYNKTMLKKAGAKDPWDDFGGKWTWNDAIEMATKCTKDTSGDGRVDQWGLEVGYTGLTMPYGEMAWMFGGDITDWQEMKYILDSKEAMQGIKFIYDLVVKKKLVLTLEEQKEVTQAGVANPFSAGKTALKIRLSPDLEWTRKEIKDFEWDTVYYPDLDATHLGYPLSTGHPSVVNKASKYPDEAYLFIKWFAGPEVMGEEFAKGKLGVPPLIAAHAEFNKPAGPPQHVEVFTKAIDKGYGIHFRHHNTFESWDDIWAPAMDLVYLKGQDLEKTVLKANADMNASIQFGKCKPYQGITVPLKPGMTSPIRY